MHIYVLLRTGARTCVISIDQSFCDERLTGFLDAVVDGSLHRGNSSLLLLVYFMVFSPAFRAAVHKTPLFLKAAIYAPFIFIILGWCIVFDYVADLFHVRRRPRWFHKTVEVVGGPFG